MALTTKSGALWQMSRAEKDEGWTDEGHAFVGREVVRSTSATAQSVGTIYCWLPPTVEDCYEDEDGKPAPLFKVRFFVGELDGDVEDLDIRQVVESLVTESVLRPPEPPKPKPKAKPKKRPVPSDDEDDDDDYDAAAPAPESSEDDEASDYEEAARKPAAKKRKAASPPKPAKKAPAKRKSPAKPAAPKPAAPPAPAPKVKPEPAPAPRPKAPAKPSGRPGAERATARYAWEPLRDNQLALAAGDNLEVWPTNESWWFARNARTGAEGRVMSGHVKVGPWHEDEDDDEDAAPAPAGRRPRRRRRPR